MAPETERKGHAKFPKMMKHVIREAQQAIDRSVSLFGLSSEHSGRPPELKRCYSPPTTESSGHISIYDLRQETLLMHKPISDLTMYLPVEVMHCIFRILELDQRVKCMLVCKRWKEVLDSGYSWKSHVASKWPSCSMALSYGLCDWKSACKRQTLIDKNWCTGTMTVHTLEGHKDSVYCVSTKEAYIITGSRDKTVKVWDSRSFALLSTLHGHQGSVLCMALAKDVLITGSSDASAIIWNLDGFERIKTVVYHTLAVLDIAIGTNNIVSCSKDRTISVWTKDYELLHTFKAHENPVNALDIYNDYLFSAGSDGLVKQWALPSGALIKTFEGHKRGLTSITIDACTKRIVTGSSDHTIRVWDMDSGLCLLVLKGHSSLVRCVYMQSNRIISASYDRSIKVWDIFSGKLILDYVGFHGSWLFSVAATDSQIISTSVGIKPVIFDFTKGVDSHARV